MTQDLTQILPPVMTLEELKSRLTDKLEQESHRDMQQTYDVLKALGAKLPTIIIINSRPRTRRKCRLCGGSKRCQECRKTQRAWNDMQAALDAIRNGTDQGALVSLDDDVMSSRCDEG